MRRATNRTGNIRTRGTNPLARTARPRNTPAHKPRIVVWRARLGIALGPKTPINIAAPSAADIGKSTTDAKLYATHPADVARMPVAASAIRGENSRESV